MGTNLDILKSTFNFNDKDLDKLTRYNENNLLLCFRLIGEDGKDIYLYGCSKESDEIKGLVLSKIDSGELYGETGSINAKDLLNFKRDYSFKEILRDDLKKTLKYTNF